MHVVLYTLEITRVACVSVVLYLCRVCGSAMGGAAPAAAKEKQKTVGHPNDGGHQHTHAHATSGHTQSSLTSICHSSLCLCVVVFVCPRVFFFSLLFVFPSLCRDSFHPPSSVIFRGIPHWDGTKCSTAQERRVSGVANSIDTLRVEKHT